MRDVPDQPTVACILLTKDRPQMARRAVASFRAQTYANKRLLIVNSGDSVPEWENEDWVKSGFGAEMVMQRPELNGLSIGALRNFANDACAQQVVISPDIFAHFDDDDLSHPNRITEQVALLQASGADVVGYREMLFWRTGIKRHIAEVPGPLGMHPMFDFGGGEAWLYSNPDPRYCIGSSLCYWRSAWERRPFNENLAPTGRGEDHEFWRGLKSVGVSSIHSCDSANFPWRTQLEKHGEPRMICSIHAGNAQHYPSDVLESSQSWKRVPVWDNWCRKVMAL